MFKKISLVVVLIFLAQSSFAKKAAPENLDSICKDDEKSNQTAVFSLHVNANDGLVLCSATTLAKTKKNFSVVSFQKSKSAYDQQMLFTSDDLMSYQVHTGPVDVKVQEILAGKPHGDPLFMYTFSCIGHCSLEAKDCSFKKREKLGETVKDVEDNEMKIQKLSHANNLSYEKKIRTIFFDALAGDQLSQEFFKSHRCGWNHYIDIDEECTTYQSIVAENTEHPCTF